MKVSLRFGRESIRCDIAAALSSRFVLESRVSYIVVTFGKGSHPRIVSICHVWEAMGAKKIEDRLRVPTYFHS
jgi:hypothetical protein